MPVRQYIPLLRSYARQAPRYDQSWWHYNRATLTATVRALPQEKLLRTLNVACGTGLLEQSTTNLLHQAYMVGLDISPDMLEQARRKLGVTCQVGWVNGQAESLPFSSGSFDLLTCANSFHFFRDPGRVVGEFQRVLRRGGWLVLTDWCDDYLACKICDRVLRVLDPAHFRTYGLERCKELLTSNGFQIDRSRRFKIDWLWGLMTVRARTCEGRDGDTCLSTTARASRTSSAV